MELFNLIFDNLAGSDSSSLIKISDDIEIFYDFLRNRFTKSSVNKSKLNLIISKTPFPDIQRESSDIYDKMSFAIIFGQETKEIYLIILLSFNDFIFENVIGV